jgi:hypothetical protein
MHNEASQNNAKDKKCSICPSKWVLILDWPGLDKVHPFKVTRSINENTIMAQFRDHALPCPPCMDKVLHALKNRTLGYDADYHFFLQTIVRYLRAPESFTITEWVSFEDFIIREYCQYLLGNFLSINADCCQGQSNEEELKSIILEEFGGQRQRRIKKESYLNLTFSEDILRSRLELMKVIEEKGIMWKTKKKVNNI